MSYTAILVSKRRWRQSRIALTFGNGQKYHSLFHSCNIEFLGRARTYALHYNFSVLDQENEFVGWKVGVWKWVTLQND